MNKNVKIAKQLVRIAKMLVSNAGDDIESSHDSNFNPSTEKAFSNPYNAGDGVIIYNVEDSKDGQLAVRKAIDVNWGYDKNPWCLAARKEGFDQDEIDNLSHEQAEKPGLYSDDALAVAWNYWNRYKAYPKRIAFKNGKLFAFSAGDEKQHVEWWDRNDKSHYDIPESNAVDDVEFLKKYGKINLAESNNASPEIIEELAENEDMILRRAVAENPKTPVKLLRKLTGDRDLAVRRNVALNTSTPVDILMKLAEDEEKWVRFAVARNPNAPAEILRKLTEDEYEQVRWGVASNPNTPAEALMKLTEDGNWVVRREIVENPKTPVEALRKLTEDEYVDVRQKIAKNPNAPADILRKLADDEDRSVRQGVVENPNAPVDILKKLAEDEEMWVRAVAEEKLQKKNSEQ